MPGEPSGMPGAERPRICRLLRQHAAHGRRHVALDHIAADLRGVAGAQGLGHAGFLLDEIHARGWRPPSWRSRHCACARPICRSSRSWDPCTSRLSLSGAGEGGGEAAWCRERRARTGSDRACGRGERRVRFAVRGSRKGLTADRTGVPGTAPAPAPARPPRITLTTMAMKTARVSAIRDPAPTAQRGKLEQAALAAAQRERGVQQRERHVVKAGWWGSSPSAPPGR